MAFASDKVEEGRPKVVERAENKERLCQIIAKCKKVKKTANATLSAAKAELREIEKEEEIEESERVLQFLDESVHRLKESQK